MKLVTFAVFTFLCTKSTFSQDSLSIKEINSIVNTIQNADLPVQQDSVVKDYPELGLKITTFIIIKTFGKELKQYSQVVHASRKENLVIIKTVTGSAFYFDQNQLVKVEEFMIEEGKEARAEWYFNKESCFYYTLKSKGASQRISLLLNLSKGFQKIAAGQK